MDLDGILAPLAFFLFWGIIGILKRKFEQTGKSESQTASQTSPRSGGDATVVPLDERIAAYKRRKAAREQAKAAGRPQGAASRTQESYTTPSEGYIPPVPQQTPVQEPPPISPAATTSKPWYETAESSQQTWQDYHQPATHEATLQEAAQRTAAAQQHAEEARKKATTKNPFTSYKSTWDSSARAFPTFSSNWGTRAGNAKLSTYGYAAAKQPRVYRLFADKRSLRDAILSYEVLGPPKALRKSTSNTFAG